MGGLFSSSALDKATLDQVQSQLTDKGIDTGKLLECSLIDNERGGTFYVKYEHLESVMRVWDKHCSWWWFEFERQGERELTAIDLAQKAGVACPEVILTGKVNLADKNRHFMVTKFVPGARDDEWEEKQPPQRFGRLALSVLKKLSSFSNLTPERLAAEGILKPNVSIDDFPLPYMPDHDAVLNSISRTAAEIGDPQISSAVDKVKEKFEDVQPLSCGPCLVHSDLHPGNLLLDNEFQLLSVVDWEEAAISDIRIDLAQACLACPNREIIWAMFQEDTGIELGDKTPWLALVALMRFMVSVQVEWYESQGKEVPDKNLSGWESLFGDAEELLIELDVLPNPQS